MPDTAGSPRRPARPLGRMAPVILAPTVLAALAAPAEATHHIDSLYRTNFYNNTCQSHTLEQQLPSQKNCLTDNVTLTVFMQDSIGTEGRGEIRRVLDGQYNPTDLNVKYHSAGVYTGDSETDVIYQRGDIPDDANATAWCEGAATNWLCDQAYTRYRVEVNVERACHETGHAVGLVHPVNANYVDSGRQVWFDNGNAPAMGCMQTPVPSGNNGQLGSLNTHNINDDYGPSASASGGSYPPYKE